MDRICIRRPSVISQFAAVAAVRRRDKHRKPHRARARARDRITKWRTDNAMPLLACSLARSLARARASCASHAARDQACYYANKAIYISMRLSMCSLLERNCRGRLRLPECAMTRMEPRAHSTPINMIRPEILIAFYLSPARLGIAQRRSKRRFGAERRVRA